MKYRPDELKVPSDKPFQNDALGRKELGEFLSSLIGRLAGPFVVALDSPWGTGKTTLVKMLMADLKNKKFECIYFNAWKVDYLDDPLVSLVSSIDQFFADKKDQASLSEEKLTRVKKITYYIVRRGLRFVGKVVTNGALDTEEEYRDFVKGFSDETKQTEDFRAELDKVVAQLFEEKEEKSLSDDVKKERNLSDDGKKDDGNKKKLIFFIDELDRCRPSFAIELLERVKHFFDIPNIIFVLSIDKKQLEASVKAIYGADSQATEYLRRFIDLEYFIPGIPNTQSEKYIEKLFNDFGLTDVFEKRNYQDKELFIKFFTVLADGIGLSLRAREHCIARLCIVMDQTPENNYLDPILVALLIVLRSNKPDLFTELISGKAFAKK